MAGSTYSRQEEARYTLQLNKMLDALPRFLVEYFNSLEFTKQPRTKIAYAYDLDTFFDFLVQNNRSPLYGMDKAFLGFQISIRQQAKTFPISLDIARLMTIMERLLLIQTAQLRESFVLFVVCINTSTEWIR